MTDKEDLAYDAIDKYRPILDICVANFEALWNPGEYMSIDECMIPYNGKYCSFKQYLPLKPIIHGIKLWILVDSCSKYIWNLEVYIGSENERRGGLNAQPVHSMGMSARLQSGDKVDCRNGRKVLLDGHGFFLHECQAI